MALDTLPIAQRPNPEPTRTSHRVAAGVLEPRQLITTLPEALRKLDPRTLWRNPVMFVTEVGAVLTTATAVAQPSLFGWLIAAWLWLTVLFGPSDRSPVLTVADDTDTMPAQRRRGRPRPCAGPRTRRGDGSPHHPRQHARRRTDHGRHRAESRAVVTPVRVAEQIPL